MNYDYPDATYARRQEILDEHRTYQQGFCYFLANDPRVPEDVRSWYGRWGLSKDEFRDTGHWPHQIYVREARRMVGDLVVNERHLRRIIPTNRSIGMGSYNMDSHNVQPMLINEGMFATRVIFKSTPAAPILLTMVQSFQKSGMPKICLLPVQCPRHTSHTGQYEWNLCL